MGVNPVGNVQKYFTFDGETSKAYNTHITGRGVFNAPLRNVEMVTVPNRNGAFALDKGNFENIELVYEASVVADSVAEFSQAVSDLRNWLCSKVGYCRLEDDYNTGEYRMAVYKSGLEVEPFLATSGQFEIIFECKPQRFLTSGETAVAVANNGTITNPTLFDAKPEIQVNGYGTFSLGNQTITLDYINVGDTLMSQALYETKWNPYNMDICNVGDELTLKTPTKAIAILSFPLIITSVVCAELSHPIDTTIEAQYSGRVVTLTINFPELTAYAETSLSYSPSYTVDINNGTYTGRFSCPIAFGDNNHSGISLSPSVIITGNTGVQVTGQFGELWVYSTLSANGTPTYFDMETGEAYIIKNGSAVSVNNATQIPAELPTLPSGATTITYDNTITDFKIVPRWWKV